MDSHKKKKINSRIRSNYIIIGILIIFYIAIIISIIFASDTDRLSLIGIGIAIVAIIQAAGSVVDSLKSNSENATNNNQVLEHLKTQKIILERLEDEVKLLKGQTHNNLINLESSIDNMKTLIINSKDEISDTLNNKKLRQGKANSFLTVNFLSNKDPK